MKRPMTQSAEAPIEALLSRDVLAQHRTLAKGPIQRSRRLA